MSIPFGSRSKLREQKVLEVFDDGKTRSLSDIVAIITWISDDEELDSVAAITAAVIDLKRYGLIERANTDEWWKQKKFRLTDKGRDYFNLPGEA